jgi:hypothetical protein
MAKSGFSEIGEFNPRQECTFKKQTDENGKTLKEHTGTDGTSECSLETKYGAIDPFASMGYFTTTCRNHMEVPKKLMTGMAELHRAFTKNGEKLSDEKTRVDRQVERQRMDDPEVERQKKLREEWNEQYSQNKNNDLNSAILDLDLDKLFPS